MPATDYIWRLSITATADAAKSSRPGVGRQGASAALRRALPPPNSDPDRLRFFNIDHMDEVVVGIQRPSHFDVFSVELFRLLLIIEQEGSVVGTVL
jgi:hypothetical protein